MFLLLTVGALAVVLRFLEQLCPLVIGEKMEILERKGSWKSFLWSFVADMWLVLSSYFGGKPVAKRDCWWPSKYEYIYDTFEK